MLRGSYKTLHVKCSYVLEHRTGALTRAVIRYGAMRLYIPRTKSPKGRPSSSFGNSAALQGSSGTSAMSASTRDTNRPVQ